MASDNPTSAAGAPEPGNPSTSEPAATAPEPDASTFGTRNKDGVIAYAGTDCSLSYALGAIDGKWKLPCLFVLCMNGAVRYNVLKRALGITNMMLTSTLKELEEYGLVERRQYNEVPPRVEYSATALAMELTPVLMAFGEWGDKLRAYRRDEGDAPATE